MRDDGAIEGAYLSEVHTALPLDLDGDGAGDLCDVDPVIRVSADPADEPDFASIQAAVDLAVRRSADHRAV